MSTDEKPTNCAVNSLFLELDTGDFYYFNGIWKKVGENVQLGATDDTGTIQITENGTVDVYDYDYADVNVPGVIPTGILPITENGNVNVTNYATAEVGVDYVTVNFDLPAFKRTSPTELSQARSNLAATTVGNYALFGGGYSYSSGVGYYRYATVDAYDTTLTRTSPTALSQERSGLAATTVGNYALFGGGQSSSSYSAVVDAYDTSLTRTTPTALSQVRSSLKATTVGNYALFGGGSGGGYNYATVDAYDTTLTRTTPTALSQARSQLAATTVGNYALFGGGYFYFPGDSATYATVNAYDTTLTRTTPTALSQARYSLAATTVGNYALFGGGESSSSYSAVVDAYDTSLTRTTPTELSQARDGLTATTVARTGGSSPQSSYALFGGGYASSFPYYSDVVDAYDTSLTRTTPTELSQARNSLTATTVGNYALFGGGYNGSRLNIVDAYTPYHDIQVFPETKYSFNNSGEIFSPTMQTITMQGPVVGYMKIKNTTVT